MDKPDTSHYSPEGNMKRRTVTAKEWTKYYAEQCIKRNLNSSEKAELLEVILGDAIRNAREEGLQQGRTLCK